MLWRVRAGLADRPGTLAELARRCGDAEVNILSLQVFPAGPGVVDEMVLDAPSGWTDLRVVVLVEQAGGLGVTATRSSDRTLRDPTERYLWAAQSLLAADPARRPALLAETLGDLLGTEPPDAGRYDGHDHVELARSAVRISRAVAFTPTERSRAEALEALVLPTAVRAATPRRTTSAASRSEVEVRTARPGDVAAVMAMHERCSDESLYRRYHSPHAGAVRRSLVERMLAPPHGAARVAATADDVVGFATSSPLAFGADGYDVGLLVEDAWQQQGIGAALLGGLARDVGRLGGRELSLSVLPGHDAVLRTVGRCGLRARLRRERGVVIVTAPVPESLRTSAASPTTARLDHSASAAQA